MESSTKNKQYLLNNISIKSKSSHNKENARLRCCVDWILHKAYRDDSIKPFQPSFFTDSGGTLLLTPAVVDGLTSGNIYCHACCHLYGGEESRWQSHPAVIMALARHGVYVLHQGEISITPALLQQTQPFQVHAHLALIEAIMKAYCAVLASVEKIVACIRKFSAISASSELPYEVEDGLLLWMKKVISYTTDRALPELSKSSTQFESVMDCLINGRLLAIIVLFYAPNEITPSSIITSESLSDRECVYHMKLVKNFLNFIDAIDSTWFFEFEDLLYASSAMHQIGICFLAELFWHLEFSMASCIHPIYLAHLYSNSVPLKTVPPLIYADSTVVKSKNSESAADEQLTPTSTQSSIPWAGTQQNEVNCSLDESIDLEALRSLVTPANSLHREPSLPSSVTSMAESSASDDSVQTHLVTPGRSSLVRKFDLRDIDIDKVPGDDSLALESYRTSEPPMSNSPKAVSPPPAAQPMQTTTSKEAWRSLPASYSDKAPSKPLSNSVDPTLNNDNFRTYSVRKGFNRFSVKESFVVDDDLQIKTSIDSDTGTSDTLEQTLCAARLQNEFQENDSVRESNYRPRDSLSDNTLPPPPNEYVSQSLQDHPLNEDSNLSRVRRRHKSDPNKHLDKPSPFNPNQFGLPSEVYNDDTFSSNPSLQSNTPVSSKSHSQATPEPYSSYHSDVSHSTSNYQNLSNSFLNNYGNTGDGQEAEMVSNDFLSSSNNSTSFPNLNQGYTSFLHKKRGMVNSNSDQNISLAPNQTTFQQMQLKRNIAASNTVSLKMQLEDKRRAIEREKLREETERIRQRQRLGKEAFMKVMHREENSQIAPERRRTESLERSSVYSNSRLSKYGTGSEIDLRTREEAHHRHRELDERNALIEQNHKLAEELNNLKMRFENELLLRQNYYQPSPVNHGVPVLVPSHLMYVDAPQYGNYGPSPSHQNHNMKQYHADYSSDAHQSSPHYFDAGIPADRDSSPNSHSSSSSMDRRSSVSLTGSNRKGSIPETEKIKSSTSLHRKSKSPPSHTFADKHLVPKNNLEEKPSFVYELSEQSNLAQSAFDRMISPTGQPAQFNTEDTSEHLTSEEMDKDKHSGGQTFSISFHNSKPAKRPPHLRSDHKAQTNNLKKQDPNLSTSQSDLDAAIELVRASSPTCNNPKSVTSTSPCVALTIPFNDSKKGVDVDRKRELFLKKREKQKEITQRRKDELASQSAKLKEEQRSKQLENEQKRCEEKLRRERIMNEYLKKKSEQESMVQSNASNQTVKLPARLKNRLELTNNKQKLKNNSQEVPKLFVKPAGKSNKQFLQNAITQCVFAGAVNADMKQKILAELYSSECKHFLILFRDASLKYRGLYTYEPDTDAITRIHGRGPLVVKKDMILDLYKYDSGSKSFNGIPSKTLSVSVDAFTIQVALWKGKQR